jgi:isopentenyl-diphosphate delta-isomerase type 1
MKTEIILVDKNDEIMGKGEKLWVHQRGKLHRAFSIFIFNSAGEMMLQQRAKSKYHSGGLWTNACCSHPRMGRKLENEIKKRLQEEMGIKCRLKEVFSFIYKAKVGDLIEHEFDHVFIGRFDGEPKINKEEAEDWKWISPEELKEDVKNNPKKYTAWFKRVFKKVLEREEIKKSFPLPLDKLYKELYSKHGRPSGQWKLWCKRPKTAKEREEVVIGSILTQRANWKNVELAIANLKKARVCSMEGVFKSWVRDNNNFSNLVKPSGFYKQKAEYLFRLSKFILKKYRSVERMKKRGLIDLREDLLSLKGIGPETADSILLYALDRPVFVIDEYTRRLVKDHSLFKELSFNKNLKQYNFLQDLFEKNLKKDYRLYQDLHALIIINGKAR